MKVMATRSAAFRRTLPERGTSCALSRSSRLGTAASASSSAPTVTVRFTDEGAEAIATAGQTYVEVADSVGVSIVTGCSQGSCGTCEVEVTKYDKQGNKLDTVVVRACIAKVSDLHPRLDVNTVMEDSIWGVDGYDT